MLGGVSDADSLLVYDDGSTTTSLGSTDLLVSGSVASVDAIEVGTQAGLSRDTNQAGDTHCFGRAYYSPEQLVSVVCAYDVEHDDSVDVVSVASRREGPRGRM